MGGSHLESSRNGILELTLACGKPTGTALISGAYRKSIFFSEILTFSSANHCLISQNLFILGANIDNSYHQLIINDQQLINYYHLREAQNTPHCPNEFFPENTRKYILKIIVNDLESASFIRVINYKHGLKTDTRLWTCIFNQYYTPMIQKHFSHHFPQINMLQEPKSNLI